MSRGTYHVWVEPRGRMDADRMVTIDGYRAQCERCKWSVDVFGEIHAEFLARDHRCKAVS